MKLICCMGLAVLILLSSFVSNAEPLSQSSTVESTGTFAGLVLDHGEARVVGAKVIIESKDFRREIVSSDDGSFEIGLPEGKYKVSVMSDGFQPYRRECVIIKSNAITKLNVTLKGISTDEGLVHEEELRTEPGIINENPPEKKPITKP